jgi:hypothetical protein
MPGVCTKYREIILARYSCRVQRKSVKKLDIYRVGKHRGPYNTYFLLEEKHSKATSTILSCLGEQTRDILVSSRNSHFAVF